MKSLLRVFLLLLPVVLTAPADHADSRAGLSRFPLLTVWAWQRPEFLEFLDPQQVGVAYLDQTLYVLDDVRADPRMQPLHVPPGTRVIAVVRIEMPAGHSSESEENKTKIVAALLHSARRVGVSALQVDFDAVKSQRTFYRDVLVRLRQQMPPRMLLSITALASWCAYDNWIADLPVDEAVPMLFRMGRERGLFDRRGAAAVIREPLCASSLGLSTDEPWPAEIKGKRLYVFHSRSWTEQTLINVSARVNQ
jgi:hypothetical protein